MPIEKVEMEMFGSLSNAPVIRVPGRKYPGVLIQGDSLHNLLSFVQEAEKLLAGGDAESAKDTLVEVRELLEGYLMVYQKALTETGTSSPYC
jgi:hypothetical protein